MTLFSVVIPTFNRAKELKNCLESLTRQTLPTSNFEIIIVDDSGGKHPGKKVTIDTDQFCLSGIDCKRFYQNHSGPAIARNLGASKAQGRYLAFTDDDCTPAPDWLETLMGHLKNNPAATLIGGRVINTLIDNNYASASQALVDYLTTWFNTGTTQAMLLTTNNFCVPKEAFEQIGGFDSAFAGAGGEDREFCYRWANSGRCSLYAPDAIVYHFHHLTLQKFIQQHLAYGRGAAVLRQRSLAYGYGPIPMEPLSFYTNLLRYPLKTTELPTSLIQTALFALSQAANAAGYFHARHKER